jgi:hypothetical protein
MYGSSSMNDLNTNIQNNPKVTNFYLYFQKKLTVKIFVRVNLPDYFCDQIINSKSWEERLPKKYLVLKAVRLFL